MTGITIVDFSNPTDSTNALAAYVAAGVPTAIVVSGTRGGAGETGTIPTTLLGNGYVSAHLGSAGSGETNFVGGAGAQLLFGGQGANILTYLAIGDGGDLSAAFDPAKDVIDLSHVDADITHGRRPEFHLHRLRPVQRRRREVRYQLDPTNDTTHSSRPLWRGDTTADFSLTLEGLVPLTAANFALTPTQSTAALANGAALTYTKVTTAAGAPTEYAYSNVQGQSLYIVRIVLRLNLRKPCGG